ncbi:MAG: FISUMP domain-containing protein [Bacteroidales bacterium]
MRQSLHSIFYFFSVLVFSLLLATSCDKEEDDPNENGKDDGTPKDVKNPATGETWLDRNLGADAVASSSNDSEAYGDLYQWGRAADGHQKRGSQTSNSQSNTPDPGHGDFIIGYNNWYTGPDPGELWEQDGSGINNPCPDGYRIPTRAEWEEEISSWDTEDIHGAMDSPLKLPASGLRFHNDGSLYGVDANGFYWSSNIAGTSSYRMTFDSTSTNISNTPRAHGAAVRCIKN